jgi:hypothetical protein
MTPNEFTQWLNLARALNFIVSSRTVNGITYVYTPSGQSKSLESFAAEYPLERLQAMANRQSSSSVFKNAAL